MELTHTVSNLVSDAALATLLHFAAAFALTAAALCAVALRKG